MEYQGVYLEELELERMRVQEHVLRSYESEMFSAAVQGRTGLTALDVGCGTGEKTVRRFAGEAFSRVIALEYHPELVREAQRRCGNEKFSFFSCNVETPDFPGTLLKRTGVQGFDVVYLSFLLLNLREPRQLLEKLRGLLKPGGQLLIVEPWDDASTLSGDGEDLLGTYFSMLRQDPYSGDRQLGGRLEGLLTESGYRISRRGGNVMAGAGEREKKQEMFLTYFSYFPEDVALLRREDGENKTYLEWEAWLQSSFPALRERLLARESAVSIGMHFINCRLTEGDNQL